MSELKEIEFDNNYPKLHGQKEARLVAVFNDISGRILYNKFPDLMGFDCKRSDGKFYFVNPEKDYMLLLFIGDKGILFPTFRKSNDENKSRYNDSIGELYKLIIAKEA